MQILSQEDITVTLVLVLKKIKQLSSNLKIKMRVISETTLKENLLELETFTRAVTIELERCEKLYSDFMPKFETKIDYFT